MLFDIYLGSVVSFCLTMSFRTQFWSQCCFLRLRKIFAVYSPCSLLMLICGWTPLTSHNRAENNHIRLLLFQIRACKLKRVLPSFQNFVCFDIIRSQDNQIEDSESQGSTWSSLGCFD